MKYSHGTCAVCGKRDDFLMALHGDNGGPMCCLLCCGKWHAEHGRRRKLGRIVIRAIAAFLDGGGRSRDIEDLKLTAMCKDTSFGIDPLGYLVGVAATKDEVIELTSEVLTDTLKLTHPDHHPPERQELAHRVTQQLLAIQPFVFPAPIPKPFEEWAPSPPRNGSSNSRRPQTTDPLRYPCPTCADTFPRFYCTTCKTEHDRRRREERENRNAKQRKRYAKRNAARKAKPIGCAVCGTPFAGKRKDARFCSDRCRQKAHRRSRINNGFEMNPLINRDEESETAPRGSNDAPPAT
jgi:hypothetical protein